MALNILLYELNLLTKVDKIELQYQSDINGLSLQQMKDFFLEIGRLPTSEDVENILKIGSKETAKTLNDGPERFKY
jgi:hypothetical protein